MDGRLPINIPMEVAYTTVALQGPPRVFLALHGYGETKDHMVSRLADIVAPYGSVLVAPNGPFPVPNLLKSPPREAYAWFFRLLSIQVNVAPPTVCLPLFQALSRELSLWSLPMTAIGYSQGGYLLPWLLQWLPSIDQVIGLCCGAIPQDFPGPNPTPYHIIHGLQDPISSHSKVQGLWAEVQPLLPQGHFQTVNGQHAVEGEILEALKSHLESTHSKS